MKFNILLVLFFLLTGCVTNQLHFAAYTTDAELSAIKNKTIHSTITSVSGDERCTHCSRPVRWSGMQPTTMWACTRVLLMYRSLIGLNLPSGLSDLMLM